MKRLDGRAPCTNEVDAVEGKKLTFGRKTATVAIGIWLLLIAFDSRAQYFEMRRGEEQTVMVRAKKLDTITLVKMIAFVLPSLKDTTMLNYHEPMPDSLMPRSAIVIGKVTVVEEEADEVTAKLEKFARQAGADWIVSFTEPKMRLTQDGWKYYKATALLLRVLDPTLISESDLSYAYDETEHMQTYGDVTRWFSNYGKSFGIK